MGEENLPLFLLPPPALGVAVVFSSVGEEMGAPFPLDHYIYIYFFFPFLFQFFFPGFCLSQQNLAFLFFKVTNLGPKDVGFAQLVALSQCMETDLGGLAAWLSQSTQPELCPILGFPLKVILPQRMASLSAKGFKLVWG